MVFTLNCRFLMKYLIRLILLILLLFPTLFTVRAERLIHKTNSSSFILVVCSYNSGASRLEQNIQTMVQAYREGAGESQIVLEDMGCRGFSEAYLWKARMTDILERYRSMNRRPQAIVILGQEAWAAYLAQESSAWHDSIPALACMATRNYIDLPTQEQNTSLWYPESKDIAQSSHKRNVGGVFTQFDVEKNIDLILKLYPGVKKLLLITDNTYGGVSIQSLVRKKIAAYPALKLELLDGRVHDIYSISAALKQTSESIILLGTWRVDKFEGYLVDKTLYAMQMTAPHIPTFTLSSLGLGYWAIGGYIPNYRAMGVDLARQLLLLEQEQGAQATMHVLTSNYAFDMNKLDYFKIDRSLLPDHYNRVNETPSFWQQNRKLVVIVLLLFLLAGFIITILARMLRHAKSLTKALSVSEAEKSLILGNIPSGLMLIDTNYNLIWKNSVCDQFTPKKCGFRLNEPCYKVFSEDKPCQDCSVSRAIEQQLVLTSEIQRSNRVVNQTIIPVWEDDSHQELKGILVRLFDVTKEKEAQRALVKAKEQAEESNRLKAAFLANMSHEIRTPLNAIVGFSSLIVDIVKEKGLEDEDMLTYSGLINQNSDTLLRLINDILDLSRLETDQLKMHKKQVDVVALCHHCVSTVKASAKPHLDFELQMPVDSFMIESDLLRLQQVIINLLTNANKFTEEGTITIHLDINTQEQTITIYVQDTGIGIAPDKKHKVFQRFEKLNEFAQGTGLGLSISEQIITRLGGRIWVDEDYTTGAKFVFTHPFNAPINPVEQ